MTSHPGYDLLEVRSEAGPEKEGKGGHSSGSDSEDLADGERLWRSEAGGGRLSCMGTSPGPSGGVAVEGPLTAGCDRFGDGDVAVGTPLVAGSSLAASRPVDKQLAIGRIVTDIALALCREGS